MIIGGGGRRRKGTQTAWAGKRARRIKLLIDWGGGGLEGGGMRGGNFLLVGRGCLGVAIGNRGKGELQDLKRPPTLKKKTAQEVMGLGTSRRGELGN